MVPHTRSKKRRFAFQTFTETTATAPSTLGFGITHHHHEGGDGTKCGSCLLPAASGLQISEMLESAYRTHVVESRLIVVVLVPADEALEPRVIRAELRRSPIEA